MKKIALFFLSVYQKVVSPLLHQLLGVSHACRFSPTCSEYARIHINKDGFFKGSAKSLLRLLYCQPFVDELPISLRK
ncbi:MAG TPA: membrane protein insertion efficiency factor YidD [Patescibacteria group bacterium]|nr:membrane protein insertion efficiency factor YidD [Patescibacteria group bacterium]